MWGDWLTVVFYRFDRGGGFTLGGWWLRSSDPPVRVATPDGLMPGSSAADVAAAHPDGGFEVSPEAWGPGYHGGGDDWPWWWTLDRNDRSGTVADVSHGEYRCD